MKLYHFHLLGIFVLFYSFLTSCSYDTDDEAISVTVALSEAIGGVEVELMDKLGHTFTFETKDDGTAVFTVSPGIYTVSASKTIENDYMRKVYNASQSEIVIAENPSYIHLTLSITTIQINNPILIKELYVGGCQKDDGSGIFGIDKCIILYNNSSERASLDNVAIGIIEPYNAEASIHSFLNNGELQYAASDWIPAINGIWYFQYGHFIEPYSELVINVYGAIDNTNVYSQSINYSKADYFCMYDVEATSSDGLKYNNTKYYPSPSEVIPTSHYLKAVKYGKANAWPISQSSPAVVIFKTEGMSPREYASNSDNIVYPEDKTGDLVYACLRLPRKWVVDAVEVFNTDKLGSCRKRMTPDLDNGFVTLQNGYGHSLVRKVEKTIDGNIIYLDTNNSSNDFYEADNCSLR